MQKYVEVVMYKELSSLIILQDWYIACHMVLT